jgi:hypothetical protein
MTRKECEVGRMKNSEDKYANIDVTRVYEYTELPDQIAGRCDDC